MAPIIMSSIWLILASLSCWNFYLIIFGLTPWPGKKGRQVTWKLLEGLQLSGYQSMSRLHWVLGSWEQHVERLSQWCCDRILHCPELSSTCQQIIWARTALLNIPFNKYIFSLCNRELLHWLKEVIPLRIIYRKRLLS